MSEHIDEDTTLDHFFCYNDIVIFPSRMLPEIPSFLILLQAFPRFELNNDMAIVAKVETSGILLRESHDSVTKIHGICIIDLQRKELVYIHAESLEIQSELVKYTQHLLLSEFIAKVNIDKPDFNLQAQFFVNHGFINPEYEESTRSIKLICVPRTPESVTIQKINKIVSLTRADRANLTVIIPRVVANVLSKTIHFMNEAAGKLVVTHFTNSGEAVLGINSDDINEGTTSDVSAPTGSLFAFHSHPDHITNEYNAFISWPSGQDILVVTQSFTTTSPNIGHFVASPEGLWIIKPSFALQALVNLLFKLGLDDCLKSLMDGIYEKYEVFDHNRSRSISPLDRHRAEDEYRASVAGLTVEQIIPTFPCNIGKKFRHESLFSIEYIKWKRFSEPENVKITFEYIPDPTKGLPILV